MCRDAVITQLTVFIVTRYNNLPTINIYPLLASSSPFLLKIEFVVLRPITAKVITAKVQIGHVCTARDVVNAKWRTFQWQRR